MREKGISLLSDENKDSSGDLIRTFNSTNRNYEQSAEPLEIAKITHFSGIPDFIDPTRSPYPIIVQSASSLQCIDGWELIEQAIHRGETTIKCDIIHIQQDSEIDVAIWKASIRIIPKGGRCIYPEEVRNTCRLFMMLYELIESAVVFSHGGDRRGDGYTNGRRNNIRHVLEDCLEKKPQTINKYLNHGEFISDEAMQGLINARVKKGFFEAIQKDKQRLIDDLKAEKKSKVEIFNAVSDRVISWFEETQTSDPTEIIIPQTNQHAPPATEIQPQQNDVPPPSAKSRKLKHWSGNPSAALEKQATEEEIYQEFIAIGQLLIETAENKELSTQDRFQIFSAQAYRQPLLIQHLKHLLAQQSIRPEGQC